MFWYLGPGESFYIETKIVVQIKGKLDKSVLMQVFKFHSVRQPLKRMKNKS